MKKVEEVKEDFKGIDLERPDDVIIDVDDEAKLARIVNSFTVVINFPILNVFYQSVARDNFLQIFQSH